MPEHDPTADPAAGAAQPEAPVVDVQLDEQQPEHVSDDSEREHGTEDEQPEAADDDRPDAVLAEEPQPAPVADDVLLAAVDLARTALLEITPAATIGEPAGHIVEGDRTLSLLFASRMPGYPGWHWTVSVARVEEAEPTVLEAELMPGENALLAPDWVPWSERLADYRAAQQATADAAAAAGLDDENVDELEDELFGDDYDDDVDVDVFGDDHDDDDEEDLDDDVDGEDDDEYLDEVDDEDLDGDGDDFDEDDIDESAESADDAYDDDADDADSDADDGDREPPVESAGRELASEDE